MRGTHDLLCAHATVFLECPVPADNPVVFIDDKLRDRRTLDDSLEFLFILPDHLFAIHEFIVLGAQFFFCSGNLLVSGLKFIFGIFPVGNIPAYRLVFPDMHVPVENCPVAPPLPSDAAVRHDNAMFDGIDRVIRG